MTDTESITNRGYRIERSGPVATVTLDNGRANIVDPPLIESLINGLPTVLDDPATRCVVIRGNGRTFVGGADLTVMRRLDRDTFRAMRRWVLVQEMLELTPKPVIAALNGHALGGCAELALSCDLRILHADATFGFPETDLGIFPGAGGSQRLPRLIGSHRAKRLIIDGTRLSAFEALEAGLVDMVAGEDFDDIVAREAERLAAVPPSRSDWSRKPWSVASGCRSMRPWSSRRSWCSGISVWPMRRRASKPSSTSARLDSPGAEPRKSGPHCHAGSVSGTPRWDWLAPTSRLSRMTMSIDAAADVRVREAAGRLIAAATSRVPCAPIRDLIGAEDVAAA